MHALHGSSNSGQKGLSHVEVLGDEFAGRLEHYGLIGSGKSFGGLVLCLDSGGEIGDGLVIVKHVHQLVTEDEPLSFLGHLALGRLGSVAVKLLAGIAKNFGLNFRLNLTVGRGMSGSARAVLLRGRGEVDEEGGVERLAAHVGRLSDGRGGVRSHEGTVHSFVRERLKYMLRVENLGNITNLGQLGVLSG